MNKKDYISALNNLKFSDNLKEKTIINMRNYTNRLTFSWKYKLVLATATMQIYFFSFGSLTCN